MKECECDLGGKFRKSGFNWKVGKGIFWKQWCQMVEPFQFCLLHGLCEELAAARLLGQVRKLMSATWGELGCCRNCCVLLLKLGCQFKDHIKFVVLLLMTVTLPWSLAIFFKEYKFTVLLNCSVFCIVLFLSLLSYEWLSFAFSLVETDVSCFFRVLKKWRSGKCVDFSLVLENSKWGNCTLYEWVSLSWGQNNVFFILREGCRRVHS